MAGVLLEQARKDVRKIITSGGFEVDIQISNPEKTITADLKGLHSKHFISFDTDGNQVNSKNAHITISEQDMVDAGFQVRNQKTGNVDLKRFEVNAKDSTGISKKYAINEAYPDETLGLIVIILGDKS